MSFEPASILLSFVVGSVGLVLFVYGKKHSRIPHLVAGLLFMVYPYFAPSALSMLIIGCLLGLGFWSALRMGW